MNSNHHFWHNRIAVFKTIILLGLIAALFLPQEHAALVGFASNVLWLYKL